MFNPYETYRKSQEAQRRWIRNHPVQYIALNAILLAGFIGYIEYKDRKELREFENEYNETTQQDR